MRITELLTKETINLSLKSVTKADAIEELVTVLDTAGKLSIEQNLNRPFLKEKNKVLLGLVKVSQSPMLKQTL